MDRCGGRKGSIRRPTGQTQQPITSRGGRGSAEPGFGHGSIRNVSRCDFLADVHRNWGGLPTCMADDVFVSVPRMSHESLVRVPWEKVDIPYRCHGATTRAGYGAAVHARHKAKYAGSPEDNVGGAFTWPTRSSVRGDRTIWPVAPTPVTCDDFPRMGKRTVGPGPLGAA